VDPENSLVLMETNLPTPTTARVYINLPEGNWFNHPKGFLLTEFTVTVLKCDL
jgi:hypothetical protein